MMEVRKRFTRPSKKTFLIVAFLFVTTISASILGSTFIPKEESEVLSSSTRTRAPESRYKTVADAANAATAEDSAKLSTGFAMWELVFRSQTEGTGDEDVAELAEVFAERMVIFTAKLELEVEDVDSTLDDISLYAEESGGFVAGISMSKGGGGIIAIRVPQEKFHEVIQEVEKLGEVNEREVKGEDITESYVDLESRLKNLQKQEERLLEILNMCVNVEELLKVESEMERVRGEIEGLTGEIKYIEGRVELATITVSLTEAYKKKRTMFPQVDWWIPVNTGLQALFTITQELITIAIVLAPFGVVGLPAYYLYKRGNKMKDTENSVQTEGMR
jgi:hypothetical protein